MRGERVISLVLGVCAVSCATAPAPKPAPLPAHLSDAAQYQKALEHAYTAIAERETTPLKVPQVDLQAAASIPIPDNRTVRGALAYFTTDLKGDVQESLIRSAQYKNMIDRVLDEYNLPKALAYLPVIESAYVPTLTSSAGAHGIWQFMRETARDYGLRVDWWVDERADPERSTKAAAAYLRDLYSEFHDWPLALAAYNAGAARIERAMEKTGATSFWDLVDTTAIPRETRGYVPTFFATVIIASDPANYGFRLEEPRDPAIRRVAIEGPVSLRYLSEVTSVDERTLRDLNPFLRHAILPPGKSTVRLPAAAANAVEARAATLKNDDADVAVCTYTLRHGDTVKKLARALGTSSRTILAMNDLDSSDRIRRGDTLYLPVRARELGNLLAGAQVYYAVRRGDTLYSVARRHNITVAELCDLNQFSRRHKLHPGEKIRVAEPRALSAGGM